MSAITGKDVIVLIYIEEAWRYYACATSCSLTVSTSMIETSTTGSGLYTTYIPQRHDITGTISGIVNLDMPNMLNLADLRALQLSMTKLLMRFSREGSSGNNYTDEVEFYITNSTDSGDVNGIAAFDIDLQGTGALTQIFTPTPLSNYIMYRYDGTAEGGETEITIPTLINKSVLSVVIDGIGYTIITSGSPGDKEVIYDSVTGTFTVGIPLEPGQKYYILYQNV
jgi:hypothetical protein